MIIQKHLSEKHNFIFNMKGKVVILDVLVVTGFCSRGLFNLKITEPSPDLGWGKTWCSICDFIYFSNPKLWGLDKNQKTCVLLYIKMRDA